MHAACLGHYDFGMSSTRVNAQHWWQWPQPSSSSSTTWSTDGSPQAVHLTQSGMPPCRSWQFPFTLASCYMCTHARGCLSTGWCTWRFPSLMTWLGPVNLHTAGEHCLLLLSPGANSLPSQDDNITHNLSYITAKTIPWDCYFPSCNILHSLGPALTTATSSEWRMRDLKIVDHLPHIYIKTVTGKVKNPLLCQLTTWHPWAATAVSSKMLNESISDYNTHGRILHGLYTTVNRTCQPVGPSAPPHCSHSSWRAPTSWTCSGTQNISTLDRLQWSHLTSCCLL